MALSRESLPVLFDRMYANYMSRLKPLDKTARHNLIRVMAEVEANAIRNVPQRKWNDERKVWQIPNTKCSIDALLQNLYSTNYFNLKSPRQVKENDNSTSSFHSECSAHSIQQELEKTSASLKVKHYSKKTIECYLKWIKDFLSQYGRQKLLGQSQINEYLTELAVKNKVSASTQNQALAALLFYFRFIKYENLNDLTNVIHAKKSQRIPVVFSKQEVISVINNLEGSKRLDAEFLYGTGMRVSEVLNLRIVDIDFDRNEIIVRTVKETRSAMRYCRKVSFLN